MNDLIEKKIKAFNDTFDAVLPYDGVWYKDPDKGSIGNLDPIEDFIREALEDVQQLTREETAKAYGNCQKCYGKGYSTYFETYEDPARGEKWNKEEMLFCKCARGNQLKDLLKK
jgi:hypothetical protein